MTTRWVFFGSKGLRAGWGAAAFLTITVGIFVLLTRMFGWLWSSGVGGQSMTPRIIGLSEAALLAAVLAATAIMSRIERRRFGAYGLADARAPAHVVRGAATGFIALSLLVGLLAVSDHLSFDGIAEQGTEAWRFAAEWGAATLLIALVEETLFRGYLLVTLARGIGFWPAAVVLSMVFGVTHAGNIRESMIGLAGAGLVGLVFTIGIWRSGSLWWAIGLHAAWDWAETYFYGTPDSGTVAPNHLLNTHPHGASWLSGGAVGPEGSVFVILILLALVPVIFLTFHGKRTG